MVKLGVIQHPQPSPSAQASLTIIHRRPWHIRPRDAHLHGADTLSTFAAPDLGTTLLDRLDWTLRRRLDLELPVYLALPGGQATVDYAEPVPLAAARAQYFYGLAETPKLAGGRVPLRLAYSHPQEDRLRLPPISQVSGGALGSMLGRTCEVAMLLQSDDRQPLAISTIR